MLYQCLTRYRGSDSSEISLNKDDMVKVLDKKDHGMPEYRVTGNIKGVGSQYKQAVCH